MEDLYLKLPAGVEGLHHQAEAWKQDIIDNKTAPKAEDDVLNYTAWVTWQVESAWQDNLSAMYGERKKIREGDVFFRPEDQPDYILVHSEQKTATADISTSVHPHIKSKLISYDPPHSEALKRVSAATVPRGSKPMTVYPNIPTYLLPEQRFYTHNNRENDDISIQGAADGTLYDQDGSLQEEGYWLPTQDLGVDTISDQRLRTFASQLHYRMFGITAKPQANSQTIFLADEEWNCWFSDALSATTLQLSADNDAKPSGFSFDMPLSAAGETKLRFDTRVIKEVFSLLPASVPALGLIENTNIMVFGLDVSGITKVSTTLSMILTYTGLEALKDSPLVKLLGDQMDLSLFTEAGARNAIWFNPGLGYRTTQRLQWKMNTESLQKILKSCEIDVQVTRALVITSRVTSWRPTKTMLSNGELRIDMHLQGSADLALLGSITVGPDAFNIKITATKSTWSSFSAWLQKTIPIDINPIKTILDHDDFLSSNIFPRRLYLEIQQVDSDKYSLRSWAIDVEVLIDSVTFLVTYTSANKRLRGQIWLRPQDTTNQQLLPGWEESDVLRPSIDGGKSTLDLAKLIPGQEVGNIPKFIPTELKEAFVEIDSESITFFASLTCGTPSKNKVFPAIALGAVELRVFYSFQGTDNLSFEFFCSTSLNPQIRQTAEDAGDDDRDDSLDSQDAGTLDAVIAYEDGVWTLAGSINALNFGSIYSLLDPDAQEDVLSVLEHIRLSDLKLVYQYKDGLGNNFSLQGALLLGDLRLGMTYEYNLNGWELAATLGSSTTSASLGSILASITGDHDVLPSFIANIPIAKGDKDGNIVTIRCKRAAKDSQNSDSPGIIARDKSYIFFQATLKILVTENTHAEVTFAQYRDLALLPKDPPKRVFKVSLIGLPTVTVPTLGELPQPFDEMSYLWIQDKKDNKAGLTQREVECINQSLRADLAQVQSAENWLSYRDTRKPGNRKPDDVVISAGSHFMVMLKTQNERQTILDYVFNAKNEEKPSHLTLYSGSAGSGSGGSSAMAPYKKSVGEQPSFVHCHGVRLILTSLVGPISISNIGLKYKDNTLYVLIDASFVLGPVGFTFVSAAIEINLEGKTIQQLTGRNVSFSLAGLDIAFDRPPLQLAGSFRYGKDAKTIYYAGGVVVGFDPYQFRAAGMYGEVSQQDDFKTAFVFAKLEGPLVTLAFAEISGITGGFGYNSEITLPTIETVPNFPFIESKEISDDLLATLGNLMKLDGSGAFTIRNGSMWFAAGLKVSAFKMLDIDAVVVVSWNPSVTIGIYAVAVADIPKGNGVVFAHVELGMCAEIDFEAGVFLVEAQLAHSSYIFDSSCRLTGGFALYYWFNDRVPEREGEWVFTIGGYHRAFRKPSYYPNPPRLGISWQVGRNISIIGEAYFAITPKCCMGGGRLRATLSAGPLKAWFSTWTDFLIKYQPFYFMAEGGVCIGISCKVDLWITSFTVSAEVGATLSLEGPPLRGRVYVDFWVMSFTVNFGPNAKKADPPSLEGFYELVLQAGNQQSLAAMLIAPPSNEPDPATTIKNGHNFTCRGGLFEGQGEKTVTKEKASWDVKAGSFVFAIDVRFALSEAEVEPPSWRSKELQPLKFLSSQKVYAKPMEVKKEITSKLIVNIDPPPLLYDSQVVLDQLSDENWQVTEIVKETPSALWGECKCSVTLVSIRSFRTGACRGMTNTHSDDEGKDPKNRGNNIKSLLEGDKGTIPMLMGLEIRPPKPKLAPDKIGTFDAVAAMQMGVFAVEHIPKLPHFNEQSANWPAPADSNPKDTGRYKKVKDIWQGTSEAQRAEVAALRKTVVDALAEGLGWRQRLTAVTPKRLVDELGDRYMRAPEISVG